MTGDLIFYKYNGTGEHYLSRSYTETDANDIGVHLGKDFVSALKAPAPMKDDITNVSRTEHGTRFMHVTDLNGKSYKSERSITLNLSIHENKTTFHGLVTTHTLNDNIQSLMNILGMGHFAVKVPSRSNEIFFLKYVSSQSYAEGRSGKNAKIAIKCIEYNPSVRSFTRV